MSPDRLLAVLAAITALAISPAKGAPAESTAAGPAAADLAAQGDGHGVLPCSSCHGRLGEGNAADGVPHLAGLPAAYLAAQLDALAEGTRRNPTMGPIARSLSARQRRQLAEYYSALPAVSAPGNAPAAELDDRVALHGRWSDEIPACVQCHGPDGRGVGEKFPPLIGQSALYIANQLRAWRVGTRHDDPLGLMRAVAGRLSERDIHAVSDYFACQPAAACQQRVHAPDSEQTKAADSAARAHTRPASAGAGGTQRAVFTPSDRPIPDDEFGKVVKLGKQIFENPAKYASPYVGNDLRCSSCHLDAGRHVGSAPLWAAYVSYPAYRAKNHRVNTFAERLQGCFRFSMNGRLPPLGDPVLVALESYAYWLARGAPLDPGIAGRGYPKPAPPVLPPNYERGAKVYARTCALCHGDDGGGRRANDGSPVFPALWGPDSFNWGAGMGSVTNAASFIKANMPLGRGGTLGDQDAWDVALYMDSQERPQDPRSTGSVSQTRAEFHDGPDWMYGLSVNGHVLGSDSEPPGGRLRDSPSSGEGNSANHGRHPSSPEQL
ncbi:MAG TPA: c-type cytochrome [Steroidobacteraceae bacterium]|nr:c-type cytochrome [Steroidobacteraceae bacterium]